MKQQLLTSMLVVCVFVVVAWIARHSPHVDAEETRHSIHEMLGRAINSEGNGESKDLELMMTSAAWHAFTRGLPRDQPQQLERAFREQLYGLERYQVVGQREHQDGSIELTVELGFSDHTKQRTYGMRQVQGQWCISRIVSPELLAEIERRQPAVAEHQASASEELASQP